MSVNEVFPITSDEVGIEYFKKSRITLFTGAFGSGKTELCVNFAIELSKKYEDVSLVDIDIVKPMFRSRELKNKMAEIGVKVISTHPNMEMADLPALSPLIFASIETNAEHVVIDVGGDDDGARVIGRLHEKIEREDHEVLYVINTKRPFTKTVDEILFMLKEIEMAARLKIHGLVANTNLGKETTTEVSLDGLDIIREVSEKKGIPLKFLVVNRISANEAKDISVKEKLPVFIMDRIMLTPWEREEL